MGLGYLSGQYKPELSRNLYTPVYISIKYQLVQLISCQLIIKQDGEAVITKRHRPSQQLTPFIGQLT